MNGRTNSTFTIRDLERELHVREIQSIAGSNVYGANPALRYFTTKEIRQKYRRLEEKSKSRKRGLWGWDKRRESCEVKNKKVIRNAHSVAAVCMSRDLRDTGNGYWELNVGRYEDIYRLCRCERFYGQPAAAGLMCTGVLVAADVVATAAHIAYEARVKSLRFIFGYRLAFPGSWPPIEFYRPDQTFFGEPGGDFSKKPPGRRMHKNEFSNNLPEFPITWFPKENVYRGVEIIHRNFDVDETDASFSDWALVRLDRKMEGQEIAALSQKPVCKGQKLYVLGHPCGLPLKYAPGGMVESIENAYYTTKLDLFSGNSGSPVFDSLTGEVIGLVSASDPIDFEWNYGCRGCTSVVYPHKEIESSGTRVTKVSEFYNFLGSP